MQGVLGCTTAHAASVSVHARRRGVWRRLAPGGLEIDKWVWRLLNAIGVRRPWSHAAGLARSLLPFVAPQRLGR